MHQTPALIAGALFALAIAVSATLAITLATTGATAADRTGGFLAAIEDVPLMTGLTEEESPALDFDKPDGRLVETYAHGTVDETEAAAFYRAVLPEFGWQAMEGLAFSREGEMLRIEFIPEERSLVVRFVLSPLSSQ